MNSDILIYQNHDGGFMVVLYKIANGQTGGQVGGQAYKLTNRQQEVLNIIFENNKISQKQLSEQLGINESAVQKHIDALKKKNIIERDSATTGQWIIKI